MGFQRWARRTGGTVEWGNIIHGFIGQSFRETFSTEDEAIEREKQAVACEAIGADRLPVALERVERTGMEAPPKF
jgi:hypothetical protein